MRKGLLGDPRVVRIMSALDADRFRTIGALFSAWCLMDEHTSDGELIGYTPQAFDEVVGVAGLARAMESVGWLDIGERDGVKFVSSPRFFEHNGQSAKRRSQDAVRKMSAREADKKRTSIGWKCGPEQQLEIEKDNHHHPLTPSSSDGVASDVEEFTDDQWTLAFSEVNQQDVFAAASKLRKAAENLPKEYVWESAWLSELLSPGLISEVATKIKSREVSKPKNYIDAAIRAECKSRSVAVAKLRKLVPDLPESILAGVNS